MATVILAGYNIDNDIIEALSRFIFYDKNKKDQEISNPINNNNLPTISREMLTPETLSAAYARISRSPKPIPELRAQSRIDISKSRKSNKAIIFDLGHSSVAEHAVFNFDILGLSRLGVEFIERFRLASFTEKSQRYVTLDGDYVTPEEIKKSGHLEPYMQLVKEQNQTYFYLLDKLIPYFKQKFPEMITAGKNLSTLEGWAKEDARYALSLATETQLGMTVNARTLEYMIAGSQSHPLKEIQDLGFQLFNLVVEIAPSIIKYPDSTPYYNELERLSARPSCEFSVNSVPLEAFHSLKWLNADQADEAELLSALGFSLEDKEFCDLDNFKKYKQSLLDLFKKMQPWDKPPRAFEWLDFKFELTLSSAAFAQLKRHRMGTIIAKTYNPQLGITIPPSIGEIREAPRLEALSQKSAAFYNRLMEISPEAAPYILMNCHRKRILLKMNFREMYHFMRLRADTHAQWDIRLIAQHMISLIRNKYPLLSLLLGGKDEFNKLKKSLG